MGSDFVTHQNIQRYRQLLKTASDPKERDMILKLLAEAEAQERSQDGRAEGGQAI